MNMSSSSCAMYWKLLGRRNSLPPKKMAVSLASVLLVATSCRPVTKRVVARKSLVIKLFFIFIVGMFL